MKNSPSSQWWDQWFQTWQALSGSQRPANPWAASLDQWSRFVSPPAPTYADVFARMLAQGKSFFSIGDALNRSLESAGQSDDTAALFNRSLEMMVRGFDTGAVTDTASPAASGLWQLPLEAWQRTASMLSGLPAETLHGGAGMPLNANWAQQLERVLKTPGLGYTREFQRQYQELAQRLLAYQEAFNAYVAAYADKSGQASELVKERLQERQKSGEEPITSAKELFDLWVDCSEEVYAKFVMSDDYVHLHGQLTNAFMALKQQERVMLDDSLDAMNLPTRREMDTLHARFQQSRRNEKSLQSRLQAMQATLDDLQKHLPALAKRPTTKKKNTSKPKTRPKTKRH